MCRDCFKKRQKAAYAANRDHILELSKWRQLKRYYGITKEEYEALLDRQGGVCAICRKKQDDDESLHVDHCHETDVVRGLLCRRCNTGLGMLGDNVDSLLGALSYLQGERHS